MRKLSQFPLRSVLLMLLALFVAAGDVQMALAQSESCAQLTSTLRSLDRNGDFRSLEQNTQQARRIAQDLQDLESIFVRGGCQQQLNRNERLSRECRNVARQIVSGRDDYNRLTARVETGQAVAQQRELALQQVARFGCSPSSSSSARVNRDVRDNSSMGNLFDRLFGREGDIIDEPNEYEYGYRYQSTLRSVCVRTCDGYYWPVSFSTTPQYLGEDNYRCQQQCPGSDVSLFYYNNPGGDAESMVDLNGRKYTSLENAFLYRQEYKSECTCKSQTDFGSVVMASADEEDGASRAIVETEEGQFPLPMRDPRGRTVDVVVAELISFPMPRRRPVRAGEGRFYPQVVDAPTQTSSIRSFEQSGKVVRIVGPDTPYARLKEEDS